MVYIARMTKHMLNKKLYPILLLFSGLAYGLKHVTNDYKKNDDNISIVINTWAFTNATVAAWKTLGETSSAVDAVVVGCSTCEEEQCDGTVGYGGSPDEKGETTLDAMIFNGDTFEMGAVGGLRYIKPAIRTARYVMEYTRHSILVGSLATDFAKSMGFIEKSLSTKESKQMWKNWKKNSCQPNFWQNVSPNSKQQCGPYIPGKKILVEDSNDIPSKTHDTISMAAIDSKGTIVVGTSSNGSKFKIPGRIGDAPIPGAGAYADSDVGAGLATGDGDTMLRFLPSFLMVELMRNGKTPEQAAIEAINRISLKYPNFSGALIAIDKNGNFSASCHNLTEFNNYFPFSVISSKESTVTVHRVKCI